MRSILRKTVYLLVVFVMVFIFSGTVTAATLEGLHISGFVDSSYSYNRDTATNSFSLDQVELDISKEVEGFASVQADIQYANGADNTIDEILEQGFIKVNGPGEIDIVFGKFNAPIGFELLDPVDMYQFSHALVFDYGLPTNLTGLMVSTSVKNVLDFNFYVTNGWDQISDNNKEKTFGGRIGITPIKGVNFGVSGITGPENDDDASERRSVLDVDSTITIIPDLTLGLEFNFGAEDNASVVKAGDDASWFGLLFMAHYDYSKWGGITFRYDYFDDKDGARIGNGAFAQQALTFSKTFSITSGLGALIEYRHDFSTDDRFAADNDTLAFEMTYSF